jgi:Flp pilus assembly protein TadB
MTSPELIRKHRMSKFSVLYSSTARAWPEQQVQARSKVSRGFNVENRYLQKQFETQQFKNQSNLVYISTVILCAILAAVFFFLVGCPLVAVLQVMAVLVSGLAIWLNRRQRYGLGSLLFIFFHGLQPDPSRADEIRG